MANPLFVECLKDVWTKVATNVNHGQISKSIFSVDYLHTYRLSGDAAPVDEENGLRFVSPTVPIISIRAIDVYIFAQNKDGEVRVDI